MNSSFVVANNEKNWNRLTCTTWLNKLYKLGYLKAPKQLKTHFLMLLKRKKEYWPNLYNQVVQVKLFRGPKSGQVITCTKFQNDFVQVITCTTQLYKLQLVQLFVQVITCTKS